MICLNVFYEFLLFIQARVKLVSSNASTVPMFGMMMSAYLVHLPVTRPRTAPMAVMRMKISVEVCSFFHLRQHDCDVITSSIIASFAQSVSPHCLNIHYNIVCDEWAV